MSTIIITLTAPIGATAIDLVLLIAKLKEPVTEILVAESTNEKIEINLN